MLWTLPSASSGGPCHRAAIPSRPRGALEAGGHLVGQYLTATHLTPKHVPGLAKRLEVFPHRCTHTQVPQAPFPSLSRSWEGETPLGQKDGPSLSQEHVTCQPAEGGTPTGCAGEAATPSHSHFLLTRSSTQSGARTPPPSAPSAQLLAKEDGPFRLLAEGRQLMQTEQWTGRAEADNDSVKPHTGRGPHKFKDQPRRQE